MSTSRLLRNSSKSVSHFFRTAAHGCKLSACKSKSKVSNCNSKGLSSNCSKAETGRHGHGILPTKTLEVKWRARSFHSGGTSTSTVLANEYEHAENWNNERPRLHLNVSRFQTETSVIAGRGGHIQAIAHRRRHARQQNMSSKDALIYRIPAQGCL